MKVKELMERVGSQSFGYTSAYLQDGLREINGMIDESVKIAKTGIVKDQRFYGADNTSLTGITKLIDVSVLDKDSNEYIKIQRVQNVDSIDKDAT